MVDAPSLQVHADDLQERLRLLVEQEGPRVSGPLSSRLDLLLPDLVRLWVRHFGGTDRGPSRPQDAQAYAERAATRIRAALNPAAAGQAALDRLWLDAYAMGTDHAIDTAGRGLSELPTRDRADVPDLGAVVTEAAAQAISATSERAVQDHGFASVGVAVARARRAVTRIETITAYETTRAAAVGVLDVARDTGADVVWVAERNGCLHCLAYSGETTSPDDAFRSGLSFADKPLTPHSLLVGPPLHPRCRCTLEVFHRQDQAVADALKREARRSVLRGWAHESESGPAKVRAADRLLHTAAGQSMPKSVQATARRAVRTGEFPDDAPELAARLDPARLDPQQPDAQPADEQEQDPRRSGDIAGMADDVLDEAVQLAIEEFDYDRLDALTAELDNRDDGSWEKAWAPEWEAFTARTGIDTAAEAPVEDRRLAVMSELVAAGVAEGDAYAEAYGVSGAQLGRDQVIGQLRSAGFEGAGFDQLARQSYRDTVYRAFREAQDATNGYLLTPEAAAADVDAFELFSGPMSRAQKWASPELLDWWEENGRVTFEEHKAQLLGQDARASGSGRAFQR